MARKSKKSNIPTHRNYTPIEIYNGTFDKHLKISFEKAKEIVARWKKRGLLER